MKLPKRPMQHNLEELSIRYFKNSLPKNWTTTKPENDYGIDQIVHIFDGEYATPYQLYVQLKSSEKVSQRDTETVSMRVATYNHLKHQLHVAMLVKYIEQLHEAYWTLLIDIPIPNQNNTSFTIHLSKEKKMSNINWNEIEKWIRKIVDYKLDSAEAIRLQRTNDSFNR